MRRNSEASKRILTCTVINQERIDRWNNLSRIEKACWRKHVPHRCRVLITKTLPASLQSNVDRQDGGDDDSKSGDGSGTFQDYEISDSSHWHIIGTIHDSEAFVDSDWSFIRSVQPRSHQGDNELYLYVRRDEKGNIADVSVILQFQVLLLI